MLASLWRIISGEQLKFGDAKLQNLFGSVEALLKDLTNPLFGVAINYVWLYKLANNLGILQTIINKKKLLNCTGSVLTDHKMRLIDGNYIFVIYKNQLFLLFVLLILYYYTIYIGF